MTRIGPFRSLGAGLLAGLVAALAMTLMMLVLRLLFGISPPPESIPDRIAPTLPVNDFFALLRRFGGYDRLKQLGVVSGLAGQLAVGLLGGALYALVTGRTSRSGFSRAGVAFIVGAVAVAWVVSLIALRPVLGANFRGLPPGPATIATALGLLLAYATGGLALILTYRYLTRPAENREPDAAGVPIGRRSLLAGAAAGGLVLASGGLLRVLYERATFGYDGMRLRGPGIRPVTPNDRFYVVTKNVVDPSVVQPAWRFAVSGMVDNPRTYAYDDLAAMTGVEQETTLMCISNGVGDGLMSNAIWTGVPLRDLIAPAGPREGVREIVLHGADGYTDTFAWEKAMEPTTLVAYRMNGEPIPETHGYPARVVVPGLFGEKNVKWVTGVQLVDHDAKGFYEQQGWGPSFAIPIRSRIDEPRGRRPVRLGPDGAIPVRGVAFAGDQGVSAVEVSTDGGRTWREAVMDYPGSKLSWSLWSHDWRPPRSGSYDLVVRATDGVGRPQTPRARGIVPQGATGYHRVTVRVEG